VSVPDGRIEVLTIIERYNTRLSAAPKKFGLEGETYHWTRSYHFNSRLYEKLLCSVFDILEDGQLVEVSFCFFLSIVNISLLVCLLKVPYFYCIYS
jgi:hypothetical protein